MPDSGSAPPRAWQRMLSGRRLDLLDPSPLDIEVEDIAHGLARVARWNGQTHGDHAFSVAQHCLLVDRIFCAQDGSAGSSERLAILLHDAPEYVIGDMISPFKAVLGSGYKAFEARLEAAVHLRFGLPPATPPEIRALIKAADHACAGLEAVQLAGFSPAEAARLFGPPLDGHSIRLEPAAPAAAQARYLARFHLLSQAGGTEPGSGVFDTE